MSSSESELDIGDLVFDELSGIRGFVVSIITFSCGGHLCWVQPEGFRRGERKFRRPVRLEFCDVLLIKRNADDRARDIYRKSEVGGFYQQSQVQAYEVPPSPSPMH